MITTADALEVMGVVAACHHRTAPRIDDREAALVTAEIWRDLFNDWRLDLPLLIKAVKTRASRHADAPEPAEIITYAREIRQAESAKTGPTPEYEALCDSKAISYEEALRRIQKRTGRSLGRELGEAS